MRTNILFFLFIIIFSSYSKGTLIISQLTYKTENKYVDTTHPETLSSIVDLVNLEMKKALNRRYIRYRFISNDAISSYENYQPKKIEVIPPKSYTNLKQTNKQVFDIPDLQSYINMYAKLEVGQPLESFHDDIGDTLNSNYPFALLYCTIIHFKTDGDFIDLVVAFSIKSSIDELLDIGNIKIQGKSKEESQRVKLGNDFEREFAIKLTPIAKYMKTMDVIYVKNKDRVYIKHQINGKINSQYKIYDGKNYVTYLTIIEQYPEYDIARIEKKYKQVSPLNTIVPIKKALLDIDLMQNVYFGITGTSPIFAGTSLILTPRYNMAYIKPMFGFELIYGLNNVMYSPFIGLKYDIMLGYGVRMNFFVYSGLLVSHSVISHISINAIVNVEYMITHFVSIYLGTGFSYFFFVSKGEISGYANIGAIPINIGFSFKI